MKKYHVTYGDRPVECNGDTELQYLLGRSLIVHPLMLERLQPGQSFIMNFSPRTKIETIIVKRVQ